MTAPIDTESTQDSNAVSVESTALFASIAAEWEDRPDHLERVAEQVRAIFDELVEWGWGQIDRDELDHATIAYSRICVDYACSEWLPFDAMPDWEDDLYCVLMDEDFWREKRAENYTGNDIAKMLRAHKAKH